MENMSVADVAAVTRNGDGFGFGGNGLWLFAILALMNGGFGGYGRYGERAATVEDLNNSANFTRLESQVRANADITERKADGIGAAVQTGFTNIGNGISNLGYEIAQQFGTTRTQTATGFCDTSKQIMESRFLNEQAINNATDKISVQIAALSQKIDQNKIEALRDKIQELERNQAMFGVVRYPTTFSYNAGASPFCAANNGGCCGL